MAAFASNSAGSGLRSGCHLSRAAAVLPLLALLALLVLDSPAERRTQRPATDPALLPEHPVAPEVATELGAAAELVRAGQYEAAVRGLVRRGADLQNRDQFAGARTCLERARFILDSLAAPDTFAVTETLADIYIAQDLYAEARAMLSRKLTAATSPDYPVPGDLPRLRYGLARLLVLMGEYSDAERLYREAIAATADPLELAYLRNGLAILHDELGNYPEAQDLYERALASAQEVRTDHPIIASVLNNLGYLHQSISDYAAAKEYYERALELHVTRGDSLQAASTMANIAEVYRLEHAYDEAESALARALNTRQRILGPDHTFVAACLGDLGEIYLETGRADRARPLFERALRIREATLGRAHPDTWLALARLAKAADATGDEAAAGRLYNDAIAALEAAVGPDNPRCAEALRDLAWFDARTGKRAAALALALRAETLSMEHARLLAMALPERQALRYASARADGLHLALSLAADDARRQVVHAAWDVVVRSRALVLDELAARQRVLQFDDPETERAAGDYAAASRRLAHLMLAASQDPGKLSSWRARIDAARRDRERREREFAARSAAFRAAESRRKIGLDEVRAALPAGAALVSFVRFERWVHDPGVQQVYQGAVARAPDVGRAYVAFVLPASGGAPRVVPLGPAAPIDRLVEAWSQEIASAPFVSDRHVARVSYRRAGARLREAVWDPLTGLVGDEAVVFLVPDGALHRISFAALPVGEDRYLIESGLRFHYLSAERDLAYRAPADRAAHGLLAMGGAEFDAALGASPARAVPERIAVPALGAFQPLPLTAEEARSVAALWRRTAGAKAQPGLRSSWRAPARGSDGDAIVLTGTEATEAAFKKLAPGRRVVHIATHGFFLDGERRLAARGTTRGIGGSGRLGEGGEPVSPPANPLRLSGLVLAGANRLAERGPDEEDGIVVAEEIAAMDLSGVEWAVLSACETGAGAVQDVEGIVGLRRAFQVAGVRSLVMSLWAVEDRSTRHWMEELYRNRFENKTTTCEAVHRATLSVLQSLRSSGGGEHPFYWAAFVAAGGWG